MAILHHYVIRSVVRSSAVAAGFLGFTFLSLRLLRFGRILGQPGISFFDIAAICLLLMPTLLELLVPLALYVGIASVLVRLRNEGELHALYALGGSPTVLLFPITVLSLLVAFATFFSASVLRPAALASLRERLATLAVADPTAFLQSQVFVSIGKNLVIYVSNISQDGTVLQGILLSDSRAPERRQVATAKRGTILPGSQGLARTLRLEDGTILSLSRESKEVETTSFKQLDWRLPSLESGEALGQRRPTEMSLRQLLDRAPPSLQDGQASIMSMRLEFFRRVFTPFACLVFAFAATSPILNRTKVSYGSVGLMGAAAAIVYYLALTLGEVLTVHRALSPPLGALMPVLAVFVLTVGSLTLSGSRLRNH